ncbi:MAG TPA: DNA polymerase III subunit epsilon, partial [Rhizomicrobium sp.]|nr:DNA polymerase III subunit epsilon [Rhizomicrobium sp.]
RRKHPGVSNRLDDLCSRYSIDNSRRTKHGALLDAQLTAEVYLELIGGRQRGLMLAPIEIAASQADGGPKPARQRPEKLAPRITETELAAHAVFVAKELGDKSLWI